MLIRCKIALQMSSLLFDICYGKAFLFPLQSKNVTQTGVLFAPEDNRDYAPRPPKAMAVQMSYIASLPGQTVAQHKVHGVYRLFSLLLDDTFLCSEEES